MKTWIGKSVLFIAALHTVFGFAAFSTALSEMLRAGFLNSVNGQPEREWAFWFIACGATWFLLGWLIHVMEKRELTPPQAFGFVTLGLVAISVAIMPASGFWLAFIPAVGLIRGSRSGTRELSSEPL